MEADPKVVLEWLEAKNGDLRALQLTALEQLCNEVLFSDNVDVFCERYPPRCFLPALCRIFLDDEAPPTVLEANARAVSYYLDMHIEWCKYITQSGEVLSALASHLERVDMTSSKSNEFGQQLIKLMKIICNHDPSALYTNGGLTAVLQFVRDNLPLLHTDVLQAGMDVIRRLFSKADSTDPNLKTWIKALSALLNYREAGVADQTLRAFANLVARFAQCGADPSPLADPHIIACLLYRLRVAGGVETSSSAQVSELSAFGITDPGASLDTGEQQQGTRESVTASAESNPAVVQAVTNILITLCCSSGNLTQGLLTSDGQFATTLAMVLQRSEDETVIMSVLRLVNILLVLLYQNSDGCRTGEDPCQLDYEVKLTSPTATTPSSDSSTTTTVGECSTPVPLSPSGANVASTSDSSHVLTEDADKVQETAVPTTSSTAPPQPTTSSTSSPSVSTDRDALHRSLIEAIKKQDMDYVKTQVDSGEIDVNYTDHLGQTLLNWAASFGTPAMVDFLCSRGANVHQGVRSSLDYAATFGRVEVCRTLLARGADPNRRDDQGRRPIDRAREQLPYPGCQQVIDLLEVEAKHSSSRIVSKSKVSVPETENSSDPVSSKTKPHSDAQRIFVHQLFPMLVGLFRESVSPTVKRQCLLLVRRMVVFIHPAHLEEISILDCQNVPFAFSLAQLIYGVLIEETDEFILRALVLSQSLLTKAPRIYVGVFRRLGLFPMIRQLIDIWKHLVPDEKDSQADEKLSVGDTQKGLEHVNLSDVAASAEQSEDADVSDMAMVPNVPIVAEQLKSNQLYYWRDWNLIWVGDLLSLFTCGAFVIVQLQPADGGLRALAIHGGVGHPARVPVVLSPGEPAVPRPGLKSHMLRMHEHLMDASGHLDKKPLWPEPDRNNETTEQDNSQQETAPSSLLSRLPPRSSYGKFEASKANWRRVGLHLGLRRPPEPPRAPRVPGSRSHRNVLQRQASSPARTCLPSGPGLPLGTSEKPTALGRPTNVVTIGPLVCSLRETSRGSRFCIQARALADKQQRSNDSNASFKEALLFFEHHEQGFCRVRISSVYPEGSTTEVEEISVVQSTEKPQDMDKKQSACSNPPTNRSTFGRRRHSLSLLTLLSKVDTELQSDGEKSSTDSSEYERDAPELFDFDALFGMATAAVATTDDVVEKPCNLSGDSPSSFDFPENPTTPEVHKELRRINEILFPRELVYETYTSGYINNWLCIDVDCLATENKDRQERAYKHLTSIRRQAIRLSNDLLNMLAVCSTDHEDGDSNYSWALHDELRNLREITSDIWSAYKSDKCYQSSVTLDALSTAFKRLADLLRSGEQAVTAYELTISGLVPALLLCLSAAQAGRWNCPILPVGSDATTTLLWYLRERRRVFLQHMFPRVGASALGSLSRRLVHALELAEHLPLRLFALASYFTTPESDYPQQSSDQQATEAAPIRPPITFRNSSGSSSPATCTVASLPFGIIRASQTEISAGINGSESKGPSETQQFTDCLDKIELNALFTFCPHLVPRSDDSYVVPGMHQIDTRIIVELKKMQDREQDQSGQTDSTKLSDWTDKVVRVNPLITAAQLERFLLQMSVKQWYDKPRSELCYWNQLTQAIRTTHKGITFSPPVNGISSIDSVGGVIDWLATDGNTRPIEQWVNPALIGLVTVAASVGNLTLGRAALVLGPRSGTLIGGYPVRCAGIGAVTRSTRAFEANGPGRINGKSRFDGNHHPGRGAGSDDIKAWFAVDLGLQLIPTAYSMAYLREAESFDLPVAPRNWNLEASNDGIHWTILRRHVDDTSIQALSGSRASWSLTENAGSDTPTKTQSASANGWRFFKVQSTGVNSNGGRELALGGLEFYGTVCATHDSVFSSGHLAHLINRASSPNVMSKTLLNSSGSFHVTKSTEPSKMAPRDQQRSSSKDGCTPPADSDITQQDNPSGYLNTALESLPTSIRDEDKIHLFSDEDDKDDDDTAEAEEHSRDDTLSERLFGVLGLLDLTSSDTNLLQYLDGLLSSDQSSEGIRHLLRHIRTQDSTDDESLSHFTSPKKLSLGSSPVVRDVSDQTISETVQPTGDESVAKARGADYTTGAPTTWNRTPITELTIEPEQKKDYRRSQQGDSSASRSPISNKSPLPSTISVISSVGCADSFQSSAAHFVDREDGTDPSRSQISNISGTYELNPEDAEALEFADTVEAIVERNISSSDSPFPCGLPPTIPDRFSRLTDSTSGKLDTSAKSPSFGSRSCFNDQRKLDCWFIQKPDNDSITAAEEAEEDGIASDPEYMSDSHRSPHRELRSDVVATADSRTANGDDIPTIESLIEQSGNTQTDSRTTVSQVSYYPSNLLRQTSSPATITLTSKPPKPTNTDDPYKISIFSTSKSSKQLRRRLRRPRPRGTMMSSSVSHESSATGASNKPGRPSQPLSWEEAGESLRLPPGLIPVFDPNPGCTNAPATTPFVLCNPPSKGRRYVLKSDQPVAYEEQRIVMFLLAYDKSTCVAQVPMRNKDATLFRYIQQLSQQVQANSKDKNLKPISTSKCDDVTAESKESCQSDNNSETNLVLKLGYRLWHPSDETDSAIGSINSEFHTNMCGVLSRNDLRLTPAMQYPIEYTETGIKVTMLNEVATEFGTEDPCDLPSPSGKQSGVTTPEQLLNLLTLLYQLSGIAAESTARSQFDVDNLQLETSQQESGNQVTSTPIRAMPRPRQDASVSFCPAHTAVRPEDFVSGRLTRKLLRQIRDPLAMASGALPDWCFSLSRRLTALFSFDSRLELLKAHAFGPARSVIWLQNQPPSKMTGCTNMPLSRSHSDGSSTSSGAQTRRSAVSTAHTLVLSSLTGQRGNGQVLSPSTASDVLLLRPSILSQLTVSSNNGCHQLDQSSNVDNPVFATLLTSLGLTLPPGFSLRSHCSRDLGALWNCLLARTARGAQNGAHGENRTATQVGRLHKEFVRLPRMPRELVGINEQAQAQRLTDMASDTDGFVSTFWDWAACLMEEHASRKTELEIQFIGEDGTGLGPTLEFYSLLAAELRRRDGLMWVVDDVPVSDEDSHDDSRPALPTVASKATIGNQSQTTLDQSVSDESFDLSVEAHAYVNTAHGLFPAAWPQDRVPEHVLHRFYILGITVAKCLQDNRRIDLPFSPPLLKLLSAYGSISRQLHGCTATLNWPTDHVNENGCSDHVDFAAVAEAESVLTSIAPHGSIHSSLSVFAPIGDDADCDLGEFVLSPQYRRLYETAVRSKGPDGVKHWLSNLLGLEDLQLIYPERARFFRQAVQFCRRKYMLTVQASPHGVDPGALNDLAVEVFGCSLDEMCLSMEFSPPSKMFVGTSIRLRDVYDWELESTEKASTPKFSLPEDRADLDVQYVDKISKSEADSEEAETVTVHNIEQYVIRTLSYCLDKGIRKQIDAFQAGFERVLPLDWLALFNGTELGQLIAGDSVAHWSREDLLAYTVPCFGFTHQSPTYQMLINVLCSFNALERRAFLQFTTGCSSLPPGGLKNLHPRLRVVRKDAGTGALPSVNTCVHYLKLPEYQSEAELRTVLLRATREIGFYLN